jgi:mRNA interferase RelE/StbE
MSYRIEWEQDAADALDRLGADIVQRILLRISWLAANLDNIKPQALARNLRDYFKLRVGDYRVIYTINRQDKLLVIEDVGHRRDIYKLP